MPANGQKYSIHNLGESFRANLLSIEETADNVYEMGTDTFVVRDGKIVAQSLAGKITPKG